MMWRLDLIVLPLIAVAMVVAAREMPQPPQIYRDCVRHGAMLAIDPGLRFCVDNSRTIHWLPEQR
jgi:hypothetical protein